MGSCSGYFSKGTLFLVLGEVNKSLKLCSLSACLFSIAININIHFKCILREAHPWWRTIDVGMMDHHDHSGLGMMQTALGNFCVCWSGLQQGGDGANPTK